MTGLVRHARPGRCATLPLIARLTNTPVSSPKILAEPKQKIGKASHRKRFECASIA
jgi:hypothetical protein